MSLLVRTWNVFHGRSHPPGRRLFLEEMVRMATGDRPAVVCLQELPAWAVARLREWSGMTAFGEVAARPSVGPVPSVAQVGRVLTALDPARVRAAFSGQANAILLDPRLRALNAGSIVLNSGDFRRAQARWLGLRLVDRLAWGKERRVCQAVHVRLPDGRRVLIANFHATGSRDKRIPDAEVMRAAAFADALASPDEVCVLAGDFNVSAPRSTALEELAGPEWGFSRAGEGIDHVLVRGAAAGAPSRWPIERRRVDGVVVSDHAPVEVTLQ